MPDQNSATTKNSAHDVIRRGLTALVFLPFIFGLLQGGMIAGVVCIIVGAMMSYEAVMISHRGTISPLGLVHFTMLMAPAVLVLIPDILPAQLPPSYVLGMMIVGLAFTAREISAKLTLVILVLCLFSIVSILMLESGLKWLILTVASVVAADSVAYFGGRAIGGPKLISAISPSKTWSGAICGVAAGGIAGYLAGAVLGFPVIVAGLAGLCIADLSIGGDLLESWFKRKHDVKDSGRLLPGHGGFLDRFDGFLLVIPVLHLVLIYGLDISYGG
jgi:phosphatidate cytidylyltransferase